METLAYVFCFSEEKDPINSCISATVSEISITAHTVLRVFKIAQSVFINQLSQYELKRFSSDSSGTL